MTLHSSRYITAADAIADWRESVYSGTEPTLYPVGVNGLERVEVGPGRVVLIGGAPGSGKTALVMQMTIDALRAMPGLRGVVANIEMTPAVLLDRQLARLSGVPLDLIAKRKLDDTHATRIDRGMATLDAIADRLAFVDGPHDLKNVAEAADDFGASLLVLDYLQRIRAPGEHGDRRGGVDALMDYLRRFADAGCGLLCLSAVARGKDKKGRSSYDGDALSLASFRESSELEYGADSAYVLVPSRDDPEHVTLRCLKHRHGDPQDLAMVFERRIQRFKVNESTPAPEAQTATRNRLVALWAKTPAAANDDGGDE